MSTRIMSACWPLAMPPTAKAVLISLADNANDDGYCWPSISKIAERTCFGRTSIIRAIAWLEEAGVIVADRTNGRHTTYVIRPSDFRKEPVKNQSARRTGPPNTPVREAANQSARCTGPVREADTNRQEPSLEATVKGKRASALPAPQDVDPQTWADWQALRKAKRAPVTETVVRQARAEASKAGLPLTRFLEIWCARGSQGLQADWLKPSEIGPRAGPQPVGKQMQAIMALEAMKSGNRVAEGRNPNGASEALFPRLGADASRRDPAGDR